DPESPTMPNEFIPIYGTYLWDKLDKKTELGKLRRLASSYMLSNFLHGEQGALLATAQIACATTSADAKLYASAQGMDEAGHVAFGVLSLKGVFAEMSSSELADRETFILEASRLMRDRFLMEEVWECMGMPVAECVEISKNSEPMQLFRQMLFSKIVPNVKRL